MANCLITKLKTIVNNDDLIKLGEKALDNIASSSNRGGFYGNDLTVTPKQGYKIYDNATGETEISTSTGLFRTNGSINLKLMNYRNVTQILDLEMPLKNVIGMDSLNILSFFLKDCNSADLWKLPTSITTLTTSGNLDMFLTYNDSDWLGLRRLVNLTGLGFLKVGVSSSRFPSIITLGKAIPDSLTSLTISITSFSTNVIELVSGLRVNNLTGSLQIRNLGGPIKFNNVSFAAGEYHVLSWTANTITLGALTINNSDVAN